MGGFVPHGEPAVNPNPVAGHAFGCCEGGAAGAGVGPMNVTDVTSFLNNGLSTER